MRAHIIKDSKVHNTIVVDSLDVIPGLLDAEQGGVIGDLWDGVNFSKPIPTPEELAELAAEEARQAAIVAAKEELALDQISKKSYAEVEAYVRGIMAGLPAPPAPTVDLIVKMGKLIKALVDRG